MREPQEIYKFLADSEKAEFLIVSLLEMVAKNGGLDSHDVVMIADSIRTHRCEIGDRQAFVIEMPPPRQMTECYFVAIVQRPTVPAFFTLEMSFGASMLCAWEAGGRHLNYGVCNARTVEEFKTAVAKRL